MAMIKVSRLNGKEYYLNSDLIEFIEETPDTVITLTTGKKVIVEESTRQILDQIVEFRKHSHGSLPTIVTDE